MIPYLEENKYREGDLPYLKQLWKDGFGDEDSDIEAFFNLLFDPAAVYITREEGIPVSVMYLVEGLLLPTALKPDADRDSYTVTYLYALSTAPSVRGKGYGRKTVRGAADLAYARGADIVALTPADENLKSWYKANVGFPFDTLEKEEVGADSLRVIFKRNFHELQEIYNWGEQEKAQDTAIYELKEGVTTDPFYWGPTLG